MSVEAHEQFEQTLEAPRKRNLRRSLAWRFWRRFRTLEQAVAIRFSSSLTRRIVVLNLGGLVALLLGFLYLNQFREGLIDARVQSLQVQGEIIAAAVAASASVATDAITIDPEKLLQLIPGKGAAADESRPSLEFSINPERIGPVLRRLVSPTRTRARIYDRDGYLLLDSRALSARGDILRLDLPPQNEDTGNWLERVWAAMKRSFTYNELPLYEDIGIANGNAYPEVALALTGEARSVVRMNARGETIVSVAVPIELLHTVHGVLLLSTQGGDIDAIIASERWAIIRVFLVSAGIMLLLSLLLAGTIAGPMHRLAEAAERVRRGIKSRQEIPDFTNRSDEIGHLSGALRDMTRALYKRMDAIESFAADVSHELKNPLTSLRSAVETLPIARTEDSQRRLLAIIQHDVHRLDRLISDISDASRLDAELARADMEPVDLARIVGTVVAIANHVEQESARVTLDIAAPGAGEETRKKGFLILGHDSRLGQVFNNLIDNAKSFSQPGGSVRVSVRPAKAALANGTLADGFEVIIDDDGPGIPADAFERIFERFYTDRPNQGFGQNSGLGLSISRQIIEAHGGRIRAMNRIAAGADGTPRILGARFVVWIRAAR
ncbi:MAG: stimulus-sensing domain-containing protein [Methylovirgula sp.]|nr:stimulus-sensing domain-containing protein [Methylovirgula sp.]